MRIEMDRPAWNRLAAFPRNGMKDPRSVMSLIFEVLGPGVVVKVDGETATNTTTPIKMNKR